MRTVEACHLRGEAKTFFRSAAFRRQRPSQPWTEAACDIQTQMTGQVLSHAEILEKLGEGGMGVVYKVRDTQLNRPVALKLLRPDKIGDPERRRRFVQEARSASALNHPGIVTMYGMGEANGTDYSAMELVSGKRWIN